MAGGLGSFVFGEEERKELLDVMNSGYLFRYGSEDDPNPPCRNIANASTH